ncbi:MAG: hypothetical protein DLM55_04365 [Acidimicrobiales bacterium]|nr:MAG: hypothetical protein DLM55_04365 [Acidimicrobiales bacterium]
MTGTQNGNGEARQNPLLGGILEDLGWSRTRLAREVNACTKRDYIGRSTVSEWVNRGRVPHDPLPTVVAHVLSEATGRKIAVADLWQRTGKESAAWVPADHRYPMSWNYQSVLRAADDWIVNIGGTLDVDRRVFLAISGAALTSISCGYVDNPMPIGSFQLQKNVSVPDVITITPGIVNVLEVTIGELRNLDDHEGGNRNSLRMAHRHFRTLAEYVKSGKVVDAHTQQRLLTLWATLCEIAGLMAFDAHLYGLAQRYWFTGLQITHTTGNSELGAHILGYLSFQAAHRGQANDAAQLGQAAMRTAAKGTSVAVQALVTSRYAQSQAALGNNYTCREAIDKASQLLTTPGALANRPEYVSWFDSRMFESQSGHSLLALARTSSRKSNHLFEQADQLLTPHVMSGSDFSRDFPRDALFWGSWRARSYVWQNELEKAVKTGITLIDLCRSVRSQRCVAALRQLNSELVQRRGALSNPHIAEFSQELNAAIAAQA